MKEKGANVYITASELEALRDAESYLAALLEKADEASHLIATKAGLASFLNKVSKAQRAEAKRAVIREALKGASEL